MAGQEAATNRTPRAFLRAVRTHKAVVLLAAVLVPASALAVSSQQPATYEATARVLLGQSVVPGDVSTRLLNNYDEPQRALKTQAELAHTPAVADRVLASVPGKDGSARMLLDDTRVQAHAGGDVLAFTVEDGDPLVAERLATEYARQYTLFRRRLDRLPIEQALKELHAQRLPVTLDKIDDQGRALDTLRAIAGNTTTGVEPARSAAKTGPRLVQSGLAGLVLGVLFGVALAFLWDALDSRVRRPSQIASELGVPELASIPPGDHLDDGARPVMLATTEGTVAEAFRYLGVSVRPALERGVHSVMVTSALPQEGKSAVAANLAVALARAGQEVVLVDLDFRDPSVARRFGLEAGPGLTDVALGDAGLDQALHTVPVEMPAGLSGGTLKVLPSYGGHIEAGELLETRAFGRMFDELRDASEVVICDGSALLGAGNATALLSKVDACLVVARLGVLDDAALAELGRAFQPPAARAVGFVTIESKARRAWAGGAGGRQTGFGRRLVPDHGGSW